MKHISLGTLAMVALAACSDDGSNGTGPRPIDPDASAVYVQTNDAAGNAVVAFRRADDGRLSPLGTFPTDGRGTGNPRLGSQGSVVLSEDGRFLFVTNIGSNEISAFAVTEDGLTLVDKVESGGEMPYSIAHRGDLMYVLNNGGSGNITGFRVSSTGELSPIEGSTRPLSGADTDPAQVSFSPDGATLVVTEKATDQIDTYAVGADGLAQGPTVHASSGATPFGFAFTPGTGGVFVVTEAFDGAPGAAAASSYTLSGASGFEVISATVRDTQTDVCWTVITNDARYAYITNFVSGTISSYTIASDGSITLLEAEAGRTGPGLGPRDEDLSEDGRFLYVVDVLTQAISAFDVQADGSLEPVGTFGGLPTTVAGLAAN
ncbi:MAG: beta-propeller fold lactonase family protein [Gemmatimonadetes bacterium]|nr:beta-propeller fold lactonase family protein [Gemmatimonadota bacterium]